MFSDLYNGVILFEPLNFWWFMLLLFMTAGTVITHQFLRTLPKEYRRKYLLGLSFLLWLASTIVTFYRIADPNWPEFTLLQNLPLHFCTIVTFAFGPIFLARGDEKWLKPLQMVVFYPGLIAAFLATIAPQGIFYSQPLLNVNILFYVSHFGNVFMAILMASLGFYEPKRRDALVSLGWFFVMAIIVFFINIALRATVNPMSNYFFPFDPEGSDIFVILWDLIGIPLLYQVPLLPIIYPVLLLQYFAYKGLNKARIFDRIEHMKPFRNIEPLVAKLDARLLSYHQESRLARFASNRWSDD